jgi:hypothetical protein
MKSEAACRKDEYPDITHADVKMGLHVVRWRRCKQTDAWRFQIAKVTNLGQLNNTSGQEAELQDLVTGRKTTVSIATLCAKFSRYVEPKSKAVAAPPALEPSAGFQEATFATASAGARPADPDADDPLVGGRGLNIGGVRLRYVTDGSNGNGANGTHSGPGVEYARPHDGQLSLEDAYERRVVAAAEKAAETKFRKLMAEFMGGAGQKCGW